MRTGMEMREQSEEETEKFLKKKELAWDGIYRVLV